MNFFLLVVVLGLEKLLR